MKAFLNGDAFATTLVVRLEVLLWVFPIYSIRGSNTIYVRPLDLVQSIKD